MTVELTPEDRRQIQDEAFSRGPVTYSSKANAIRAFRTKYATHAGDLSNAQIVDNGHVDEDEPGKWVVNDPNIIAEQESDDFVMSAEELAKQGVRPSVQDAQVDAEIAAEIAAENAKLPGAALEVHNTALPKIGVGGGNCPHCNTFTLNGNNVTEFSELSSSSQRDTNQQFTCNSCAGEWGPVVDKPKAARAPSGSSNGLKIEANRTAQNGVTRPSVGGKCRSVWDMLDAIGTNATAKQAREQAVVNGFDKTTTMVQFYRWRKFNGIEGRQ